MMTSEDRVCQCGYKVSFKVISDAHDPHTIQQFVAVMLDGHLAGKHAVTDYCPQCGHNLFESTVEKV